MAKDDVKIELTIEDVLKNIDSVTPSNELTEQSDKEEKIVIEPVEETISGDIEDEMTRFFDEPILAQESPLEDKSDNQFQENDRNDSLLINQVEVQEQLNNEANEIGNQVEELAEELELQNNGLNIEKELSMLKAMNQPDEIVDDFEKNEWDPSFNALNSLMQDNSEAEVIVEERTESVSPPNPAGNVDMSLWEELVMHENDIKHEEVNPFNQNTEQMLSYAPMSEEKSEVDFTDYLSQTGYSVEDSNVEDINYIISSYRNQISEGENDELQDRPYFSRALEKESVNTLLGFPADNDEDEELKNEEDIAVATPKKEKKNLFSLFTKRMKVVHPTIEPNTPRNFNESYNYIDSEVDQEESTDFEAVEELEESNFEWENQESDDFLSSLDNQIKSDSDTTEEAPEVYQDLFAQFADESTVPVEELTEFEFNEELPNVMLESFDESSPNEQDDVKVFDEPYLTEIETDNDEQVEETADFPEFYYEEATESRIQSKEAVDEFDNDEEEFELFGSLNQVSSLEDIPKVEYAGIFSRVAAFLIDNAVIFALQLIVLRFILEGVFNFSSEFGTLSIQHLVKVFIYLLYFILFTKLTDGQTLGKMMFGIQVVCLKEERLSWTTVLLREGCMRFVLSTGILFLGYFSIFFTKAEQPADMLCSTRVIKTSSVFDFYDTLSSVESR